jgi:SAM-dependent methyltransferase
MVPAHQGEEARIRLAYARRQTDPRYSWFSRSHLLFMQERERYALAALKREGLLSLESKRILEIGCGTGHWLREFVKWGALPEHITGVDLLPDKVATARKLCPEQVAILCGNATQLALPDEAFDLVFQSTVFTSMLDADMKRQVASEMRRVVKPLVRLLHRQPMERRRERCRETRDPSAIPGLPSRAATQYAGAAFAPVSRSVLLVGVLRIGQNTVALYALSRRDSEALSCDTPCSSGHLAHVSAKAGCHLPGLCALCTRR